ncbi:MAG: acyltransferase [bacterium]|nr:acyltransferase [bacterium]
MQTNANSAKQERNMGVELLRIVSMLMVVILHILGQGGVLAGVEDAPDSARYAAAYLLESGAYMAVNCYALISGYVGAEHPFRYARLFEIYARVLFYTILITAGFCIAEPGRLSLGLIVDALLPATRGQYWYYTAYLGLMLFMPALQCMIAHLTKVQFRNLTIALILLFSVLPTFFVSDIFQVGHGYSLWWLIALYLIGAYIKKYGLPFLKRPLPAIFWYVLCVLAAWGVQLAGARSAAAFRWKLLDYTSPAMLFAGVSLLTAFSAFRLPAPLKRAAALCAPLSFSVYLIHVHPLLWNGWLEGRFAVFAAYPALGMAATVVGAAAGIYVSCTLIDAVRAWLFRVIKVRAGCEWLETRMKGFLEGRAGG